MDICKEPPTRPTDLTVSIKANQIFCILLSFQLAPQADAIHKDPIHQTTRLKPEPTRAPRKKRESVLPPPPWRQVRSKPSKPKAPTAIPGSEQERSNRASTDIKRKYKKIWDKAWENSSENFVIPYNYGSCFACNSECKHPASFCRRVMVAIMANDTSLVGSTKMKAYLKRTGQTITRKILQSFADPGALQKSRNLGRSTKDLAAIGPDLDDSHFSRAEEVHAKKKARRNSGKP
mmetsp:Transcript_13316/g.17588  ORF Transcript_13316/g.17588 Transcript_13316/m.17588 type:complete len:234 (-) Transcript_13316:505-1206(-)